MVKRAAVVGLGYVGLPLLVTMAEKGIEAVGIDVNAGRCARIGEGRSDIGDVSDARLAPLVAAGRLRATTDFSSIREVEAVSICVPTPLSKSREPDVSYILSAIAAIAPHVQPGQIIILESTTYPGTTEELLLPRLQQAGLVAGETVFLAFSPERIDPANTRWNVENTPKVIGGTTPACLERAAAYYRQLFGTVVEVSSSAAAEMVKLLENTFRSVNIGLVNEVAQVCHQLGLDVWEIVAAAATKPFGFMPFYPGPGLGGHCIPVDPHYLSWRMKSLGYTTRFIELASEVNSEMPRYAVRRLAELLNDRRKPLNGSRVLMLGIAYKKNVDDTRVSPAMDIAQLLVRAKAEVEIHDPHVAAVRIDGREYRSVELTPESVAAADAVIVTTDHDTTDWEMVARHARLIFDTRNAMAKWATVAGDRLVRM
jgi:UDP-N-acetyl-D-glucosamine dehydrogenase